jgi:chemotaxis protein methyltransferase CheR
MNRSDAVEWKLITDLIEERFGLIFDGVRGDILESRLQPRLRALRLDSLRAYYHFIRFHPEGETEIAGLGGLLTNNETYFFREPHHFELLTGRLVPERRASLEGRALRILSAGCSSGEEAYSIVISLQNAGCELSGPAWEVDGCDLNRDRIAQARDAVYENGSLRVCDETTRRRYFREINGRFHLRDRHRKGVRFFETNLRAPGPVLGWAVYDVIFCRNMLIYFGERAFTNLINLFARSLRPGGYLLLGHSESLLDRTTDFDPIGAAGGVVYRKRNAA